MEVVGLLLDGCVAEFENDVRRQRQTAGIKAAKAKGKTWGGSEKGWTNVGDAQAQRILRMHRNGLSKTKIAKAEGLS